MTTREDKRFTAAVAAMQSLILSYDSRKDPVETMPGEVVAQMAIWHADALIKKLEETAPPVAGDKRCNDLYVLQGANAMTDIRAKLDELQKLCDGATPGEWNAIDNDVRAMYQHFHHRMALASNKENAKFIAASRAYMPLLIEVARAARKISKWAVGNRARGYWDELQDTLKELDAK